MKLVAIKGWDDYSRKFKTVSLNESGDDILQTVFENGKLLVDDNLNIIRERSNAK